MGHITWPKMTLFVSKDSNVVRYCDDWDLHMLLIRLVPRRQRTRTPKVRAALFQRTTFFKNSGQNPDSRQNRDRQNADRKTSNSLYIWSLLHGPKNQHWKNEVTLEDFKMNYWDISRLFQRSLFDFWLGTFDSELNTVTIFHKFSTESKLTQFWIANKVF